VLPMRPTSVIAVLTYSCGYNRLNLDAERIDHVVTDAHELDSHVGSVGIDGDQILAKAGRAQRPCGSIWLPSSSAWPSPHSMPPINRLRYASIRPTQLEQRQNASFVGHLETVPHRHPRS